MDTSLFYTSALLNRFGFYFVHPLIHRREVDFHRRDRVFLCLSRGQFFNLLLQSPCIVPQFKVLLVLVLVEADAVALAVTERFCWAILRLAREQELPQVFPHAPGQTVFQLRPQQPVSIRDVVL